MNASTSSQRLAELLAQKARVQHMSAPAIVAREASLLSHARQDELAAMVQERLTARDWIAERNS
jgi:hypothetical protein